MPQQTNLNVNPYLDDFDVDKIIIVFKPDFLQAGTNDSTIDFMNNLKTLVAIFKEGSIVIPGNVTFDNQYYAVEHSNSFRCKVILITL